jgi:ferredoxin-NADP reductase
LGVRGKISSVPFLTLTVVENRPETPRNRIVRLALGSRPFPFRAGQFVLLGEAGGLERRPYSLATSPSEVARAASLEFLIQVDEEGSPGPHIPTLEPGTRLDVEGPGGDFTLPEQLDLIAFLFVAGGTGVAPVRSMIRELLERVPGARIGLVQTARGPEELSYRDEFRSLAAAGRIQLVETVTRDVPDAWQGARGRVAASHLEELVAPGQETMAFVCGPDSLVESVPLTLASLGITRTRTEHWAG